MKTLKIVLQSKKTYLLLLLFLLLYILFFTRIIKYTSKINDKNISIKAVVKDVKQEDEKRTLLVKEKELIKVVYFSRNSDINENDLVEITGEVVNPLDNTIPNTFNYKKNLYNNKIYKIIKANKVTVLKSNSNIFYKIKNLIKKRCKNNKYLHLFILGDKSLLENDNYNNYKNIGIAHLLAISGMHIYIFIKILDKLLFFITNKKRVLIISLILLFYSFVVGFTSSVLRVVFYYIIKKIIVEYLSIDIPNIKLLIIDLTILIIINPFVIYNIGFLYSFSCAFGLILSKKYLKKNYLLNIIITTFYLTIFTLPITASLNYEINLLVFLSNIIMIPLVSFIIYPLSLITFCFPFLEIVFNILTFLMEKIVYFISLINIFIINIPKLNIIIIGFYYYFVFKYVYYYRNKYFIYLILLLISSKLTYKLNPNDYVYYVDVGQGDSTVLISSFQKEVIMIDTGGQKGYYVSDSTITFLKSVGITKIDLLIITHGDYDHASDAINVINKMHVKNVYLNNNEYNALEKEIIKQNVTVNNYIPHIFKLKNLNKKIYKNENDSSLVYNIKIKNTNFLFMADISKTVENTIDATGDIIKLSHHGSNTANSLAFLKRTKASIAIISSGKNNIYNHPSKEVINSLNKISMTYYNTQDSGTIIIKVNNSSFSINKTL